MKMYYDEKTKKPFSLQNMKYTCLVQLTDYNDLERDCTVEHAQISNLLHASYKCKIRFQTDDFWIFRF